MSGPLPFPPPAILTHLLTYLLCVNLTGSLFVVKVRWPRCSLQLPAPSSRLPAPNSQLPTHIVISAFCSAEHFLVCFGFCFFLLCYVYFIILFISYFFGKYFLFLHPPSYTTTTCTMYTFSLFGNLQTPGGTKPNKGGVRIAK